MSFQNWKVSDLKKSTLALLKCGIIRHVRCAHPTTKAMLAFGDQGLFQFLFKHLCKNRAKSECSNYLLSCFVLLFPLNIVSVYSILFTSFTFILYHIMLTSLTCNDVRNTSSRWSNIAGTRWVGVVGVWNGT